MSTPRSKLFAALDEVQDAQHASTARLILPDALSGKYAHLIGTPPARTYPLSIESNVLEDAALEGRLCWRAFQRASSLSGTEEHGHVTLSGAVLGGVPRRQVLRVVEQFSPQAPELLRLYAADCVEFVQHAGKAHAEMIGEAVEAARAWALTGRADWDAQRALRDVLTDELTAHDDVKGVTAAVRCAVLALHSDPGTAAQGANFTAHHLGRTLAAGMFPEGNARARVLGDVDRALSRILARYDGGAA